MSSVLVQARAVIDGSGLTEIQKQVLTARCVKNSNFAQLVVCCKGTLDSNEVLVELYEVINQATNVINESQLTLAQKSQLDFICESVV